MDQKLILRFRNASKAGTSAGFPVNPGLTISIGRDPSCEVQYDRDGDDLVSRQHARITVDPGNPPSFSIADLGSRNGTFVNNQRIGGTVKLNAGDLVQFGPGGPEFEFDLDPRPAVVRPTRLASELPALPKAPLPTREVSPPPPSEKVGVGKATIERMIVDSNKKATSKVLLRVAAGVIGLVAMGAAC